ncbi:hypothetical protein EQZ23_18000 [Sphingomonas sp. UV9]|uniref:hypothetical protein n=1 Tax=Sphingomonas sp. UV9 TaxID=1851410 RepID=UPI000FFBCE15|nr:hypothetical protein [Sphingomonas sp. UV9]RXD02514.1 hypothetical protein EQZ23_18000 [Sphingomonas sp. UV9]
MIIIEDSASAIRVLAGSLDPPVRAAVVAELLLLTGGDHDLTDETDVLVVQQGDTEADIIRQAGFSPLVDQITGIRFDQSGFEPAWDLLTLSGGVFRMVITYGSTFATILLVPDVDGIEPALLALCRSHTQPEGI